MLMRPVIVTCTAFVIRCERWSLTDLSQEYAGDSAHSWCRLHADGCGWSGHSREPSPCRCTCVCDSCPRVTSTFRLLTILTHN